jgi:hypothetical protein
MPNRNEILQTLNVRLMSKEDIKDVVDLHYKILHWSFNGRMGKEHIHDLYNALLMSDSFFGCVCFQGEQLLGFLTASTDFSKTRSYVTQVYKKNWLKLLLIILKNPRVLLGILESKFIVPLIFNKHNNNAEWLTFVTDTEKFYISPFVSIKLMQSLNDHFKSLGIQSYMAQGVKNNPRAMKYYEKLNWKVIKSLYVHNIYYFNSEKGAI